MKKSIPKGVLIAGTDTGVGKTIITAAVVRMLREHHLDAVPMKPVQTGCINADGRLRAPDIDDVLGAAGLHPHSSEMDLMCPFRFTDACSPHLAAARTSTYIDLGDVQWAFNELRKHHPIVVVEGAGGLMVPINDDAFILDLPVLLDIPVVLVTRAGLGTINHTILSIEALHARRIPVLGMVFNDVDGTSPPFITEDNPLIIHKKTGVPVLARIPYMREHTSLPELAEQVTQILEYETVMQAWRRPWQ